MTIDRACEILDSEHREHYESIDPVNEACRMAINALRAQEKEPCEFCKSGYTSTGKSLAEYVSDDEYNFCPICGRPLKGE